MSPSKSEWLYRKYYPEASWIDGTGSCLQIHGHFVEAVEWIDILVLSKVMLFHKDENDGRRSFLVLFLYFLKHT